MTKSSPVDLKSAQVIDALANVFVMVYNSKGYVPPISSKDLKDKVNIWILEWLYLNDEEKKYMHKCIQSKIPTIHYGSETGYQK